MQKEITETLVSFKVAELAKEKRFFAECRNYYDSDKKLCEAQYYEFDINNETSEDSIADILCTAPTQDLLQTWLRKVHRIYAYIKPIHSKEIGGLMLDNWEICIEDYIGRNLLEDTIYIHGHDEARDEALFQALNLLPDVNI